MDNIELNNLNRTKRKLLLWKFFNWLNRRGFLNPDLQCDPEHQIETFLNQYND